MAILCCSPGGYDFLLSLHSYSKCSLAAKGVFSQNSGSATGASCLEGISLSPPRMLCHKHGLVKSTQHLVKSQRRDSYRMTKSGSRKLGVEVLGRQVKSCESICSPPPTILSWEANNLSASRMSLGPLYNCKDLRKALSISYPSGC